MTIPQAVAIYATVWWLILFMALPIGVRPAESPAPGTVPSAPDRPHLGRKCLVVTILAALITYAIDLVMQSNIVTFH